MAIRKRNEPSHWFFAVGVLSLSSLFSCSGEISGGVGSEAGGPGATNSTVDPTLPAAAENSPLSPTPVPVEGGTDPGTKGVHRLNDAEYNNTVRDLFADPTLGPARGWLPGEAYGFDNIAETLRINDAQYEKYFNAAVDLAASVFARPDQVAQIVTCTPDADPNCVQTIVQNLGLRVWRRPLEPTEVTSFVNFYDQVVALGLDHTSAIQQVLRGMLSSPQFIYRMEFDPDPASTVPHPLTQYELASRLSYFLWSSTPDDALLGQAGQAALADPATLAATVQSMIMSPKSDQLSQNFFGQWLSIREVPGHDARADLFPGWGPDLGESMAHEAYSYFSEFLRTDLSWTEFVRADMNFVDARLAQHYGMPAPATDFARVSVTDDQRTGFLGLGAFLTVSSYPHRTSPTSRARRILSDLLCTPPPQPPPEVAQQVNDLLAQETNMQDAETLAAQDIGAWLAQHRADPGCASCHSIFDPYGLALENFDAIGQYRTTYPSGTTINPTSTLPDGTVLDGLNGVVEQISADPRLTSCVAEKIFIYGLGRGVTDTDRPYIDAMTQAWVGEGAPTLSRLIQGFVASAPFLSRRGGN